MLVRAFMSLGLALAIALGVLLFFTVFPNVDIALSQYFYKETFWLAKNPIVKFIHKSVFYVAYIIYIYALALLLRSRDRISGKRFLAFITTYGLVPGAFVNSLLKAHWGRPRPNQVDLFGGHVPFYKVPLLPTGLEAQYAGYVSGHAALAFFVTMIGVFVDQQRQRFWILMGFSYWAIVALVRVVEGGHFLSDVLLAGCYVWSLSLICYYTFSRFWLNK